MTYCGFKKPLNKIVVLGEPKVQEQKIETATNMYAGRLVTKGTNDDDIVVADGRGPVLGWLGFEHGYHANLRPADVDTIYTIDAYGPVLYDGDFVIVGSMAAGTAVDKGDKVASWTAGQVVKGMEGGDGVWVGIPFSKQTSEYDTSFVLPTGAVVKDVMIEVATASNSATIDVGILSTEVGGDADGFIDGESIAATGFATHVVQDATAGNLTVGALLSDDVKSGDSPALYFPAVKGFRCDGTAKTVSYKTSNHEVVGTIWLKIVSQGVEIVGKAEQSLATTGDLMIRSFI